MASAYTLRINTDEKNYEGINSILNVRPTSIKSFWEYSLEEDHSLYINAIRHFIDILDKKLEKLRPLGISSEDITVWYYYEYDEQCNMEFLPIDMKCLGELDITLCVSCWQK